MLNQGNGELCFGCNPRCTLVIVLPFGACYEKRVLWFLRDWKLR